MDCFTVHSTDTCLCRGFRRPSVKKETCCSLKKLHVFFFSLLWEWCYLNKIFKCMSIIFISFKVWFQVWYTVYTKRKWFSKCLLQHRSGLGLHSVSVGRATWHTVLSGQKCMLYHKQHRQVPVPGADPGFGVGGDSARWSECTIIIVSDVYGAYDAGKLK